MPGVVIRPLLSLILFVVQDWLGYLTGRALSRAARHRFVCARRRADKCAFRVWRRQGTTYMVSGWATILVGHAFWVLVVGALIAIVRAI